MDDIHPVLTNLIIPASPNHPNRNALQEVQSFLYVFECLKANSDQEDIVAKSKCSQGSFISKGQLVPNLNGPTYTF